MKKGKELCRRIVSLTLTLVFGLSMFAVPAGAADSDGDSQATVTAGEFSVTSDNSVGDLLANTLTESQEDQTEACLVTELEVSGSAATVSFSTLYDSDIVVGIYTEDGSQLLASGTASVTSEEETATVALTGDMPEYFIATAYLLDAESHHPVSKEYTTQLYTREMQELLRKTTADFDPDRVLNLDGDTTTNFAVFSEDTVMLEETADQNVLTDNGNGTYTITNADSTITSLQPGDVFTYSLSDGMLVVVVESISVNGSTVTITEKADADMADAFDYVKIEAESGAKDLTYGDGTASARSNYGISTYGLFDEDDPLEWSDEQTLDIIKIDEAHVTGSVSLQIKEAITCYVVKKDVYVRVQIDVNIPVNFTLSGSWSKTFEFDLVKYEPFPGVWIKFAPGLILSASGSMEFSSGIESTIGVELDTRNAEPLTNLSRSPHIADGTKLEFNASLYVGVSIKPEFQIALDFGLDSVEIMDGYIRGETGLQMDGNLLLTLKPQDESVYHDCEVGNGCITGTIDWKGKIEAHFKLALFDPWDKTLFDDTVRIGNYYYSIEHNEFAFGSCPHCTYRISVHALDKDGNPLANTAVYGTALSDHPVTDENGDVVFYLPLGSYVLAVLDDTYRGSRFITADKAQEVTIQLSEKIETNYENRGVGGTNITLDDINFDGVDGFETSTQKCGDNVYWTLKDGKLIISGTGPMNDYSSNVYVPWYSNRDSIISVYISHGVTSIGKYAFYGCSSLTSITIPDSVTSIGNEAFYSCGSLTSITIPDSVTSIGTSAFSGCRSLTSITIPDSVTSIGNYAFGDCNSLTSITIPDSVTSIGDYVFEYCSSLTSITIPDSVTSIGSYTFRYCSSLTSITIPDSVTSIGSYAFYSCSSLTSITIPDSVTSIGASAFAYCRSLTSITIPDSVTSIGASAFVYCSSLTSITIPDSVTSIGDGVFSSCRSLTSITIPDSVTSIGASAFAYCRSLTSITIPDSVTSIGYGAFTCCSSLTGITIPDGVTSIGSYAFDRCSGLTSITIPDGVTSIGNYTFRGCDSLTSITIPNSVTSIGSYAFDSCRSLTSITIPDSVISIGNRAFINCGLKHITIPDNVNSIEDYTFYNCSGLTSITLSDSVTSIGSYAFGDCNSLTSITIPDSVTTIGNNAFYGCYGLTSITISDSVVSIGDSAFTYCHVLSDVYYSGSESDWNAISIDSGNTYLTSATIHYNSTGPTAEELAALAASVNTANTAVNYTAGTDDFTDAAEILPPEEEHDVSKAEPLFTESTYSATLLDDTADTEDTSIPPTTGSGQQITSSFEGLVAEEEYVLIVAGDIAAEELFAADNLLYIAQATADSSGKLSFTYFLPESVDVSNIYARAFGKSNKDLADAVVVIDPAVYDGLAQTPAPIVVYNGIVLEEGTDYTVAYANNDRVGTATATVIGKINYTGTKTVSFTITNGLSVIGDLNNDALVDARDMILLTRYVADWGISIREELADVNGDGVVDGKDVIRIIRYLSGWGEEYALAQ